MFELKGIVPPLVTPLHEDETIDEAALERQLGRVLEGGVHGIYFLGSTGEQPALRDSEKARAIRIAKRVVNGRVPLIVGCMASSTSRAIDNIQNAEANGADAVAVTPPHYYNTFGEADQLAHYQACIESTRLPFVIYNIPLTTKVAMSARTMARIAEDERVRGIKDSTGDFPHFLRLLDLMRGRGRGVLIGSPPLAGAAVLYGGSGAVASIANLDPALMVAVYDAAKAGDVAMLQALQVRVHRLMDLIGNGVPIACLKTALEMMGVCKHYTTRPLQPLNDEKRQNVTKILQELELLT